MIRDLRMRWLTPALALLLALSALGLRAFAPNTIFGAHSEFGHRSTRSPTAALRSGSRSCSFWSRRCWSDIS